MKTRYIRTSFSLLLLTNSTRLSVIHAQLSAPIPPSPTQSISTPDNTNELPSDQTQKTNTQKVNSEIQKSQQNSKPKHDKIPKANTTPKLKLISKKQLKEYFKTALTGIGVTGAIVIMVSKDALDFFVNNVSKVANSIGTQSIETSKAFFTKAADTVFPVSQETKEIEELERKLQRSKAALAGLAADVASQKNYIRFTLLRDMIADNEIDEIVSPVNMDSLLQEWQLDVNFTDSRYPPLLVVAARNGNVNAIHTLIAHKANINIIDGEGSTALLMAIIHHNQNTALTQLLLEHQANPNIANNNGYTPLMIIAAYNNVDVMKILLNNNAFIDAADNSGRTALAWAAEDKCLAAVETLLAHNANPNTELSQTKSTPLHAATSKGRSKTDNPDYCAITKALLNAQANINAQNNEGQAPLHCAAYIGCSDTINLLLERKANPTIEDSYGTKPYVYADTEELRQLLSAPPEEELEGASDSAE